MAKCADESCLLAYQSLTKKQREVLDLLLEYKTSKEIAQELEISPHTVDQRLSFARKKLHTKARSDLANRYREMKQIYEPTVYRDSHVSAVSDVNQSEQRSETIDLNPPDRIETEKPDHADVRHRLVPGLFDGRYGRLIRLAAIVLLTAGMLISALGGIAIFSELIDLFDMRPSGGPD